MALRRGIRAAIGVPIASAFALMILPGSPAALVSAFGSLCLIAICDFGGSLGRRLLSLLGAGVAGAVIVAVGIVASHNVVSAVLVTFCVGVLLAFAGVLRGSIASGAPAMTIMYVVAVTLGLPIADVGQALIGWLIAVAVAIPITLFVLPRADLGVVRRACVIAIEAFSDAIAARGRGEPIDEEALREAQDALRRSYLGNPFRAAGMNRSDRALITLAGQLQGLLSTVVHGRAYPTPMAAEAVTQRLNEQSSLVLREAAAALSARSSVAPSGRAIVTDWQLQWETAVAMLTNAAPDRVGERVHAVADLFPDRTMAVASVRVVMLVRRVLGMPDEDHHPAPDTPTIPAPPIPDGWDDIRANATLRSPWARLSLRVGLGLAIAVLVVQFTGLAHGLWVVLGVTSVLRFDGLTTMRTAGYALLGTFAGAALGYLVLASDTSYVAVLWVVLVVVTFLAVWVPPAIGFAWGQAAFSLFVIVAFTLMTWPPDLATAPQRLEDVAVGAAVSVVVALLLWPGGVLAGTIANVADAVRTTTQLLREAVTSLVVGGQVEGHLATEGGRAMERAEEVVELSISSTNGGAVAYAHAWQALIDHLRNPNVAGRLLAGWAHHAPTVAQVVPQLETPLMQELEGVTREWDGIADQIDTGDPRSPVQDSDTLDAIAAVAGSVDVQRPDVADRVVAAIWGHGWMRMCLAAGRACEVPGAAP